MPYEPFFLAHAEGFGAMIFKTKLDQGTWLSCLNLGTQDHIPNTEPFISDTFWDLEILTSEGKDSLKKRYT